jgi:hypothetical protein
MLFFITKNAKTMLIGVKINNKISWDTIYLKKKIKIKAKIKTR